MVLITVQFIGLLGRSTADGGGHGVRALGGRRALRVPATIGLGEPSDQASAGRIYMGNVARHSIANLICDPTVSLY